MDTTKNINSTRNWEEGWRQRGEEEGSIDKMYTYINRVLYPISYGVKFGLPLPTEDSRFLKIGWQSNKRKVENAKHLVS